VRRFAVVLLHYPVLDREGRTVTSAVTNIDIHDIARSAFTYGVEHFYLVHPIVAQRTLVQRVRTHWVEGSGKERIPDRAPPMQSLRIASNLEEVLGEFGGGKDVELWTTSAKVESFVLSHTAARARLREPGSPVVLAFGTGWGLAEEVHRMAQVRLAPIVSPRADRYNHLSVRAAVAILLDRLMAEPSTT
jgi:hypothetical protein